MVPLAEMNAANCDANKSRYSRGLMRVWMLKGQVAPLQT